MELILGNYPYYNIQQHLLVGGKVNCERAIDRKTRTLFSIYGALHPKLDIDRLYIPRKEGGRGLISVEGCVELAIRGFEVHNHGSEERLIQATRRNKIDGLETTSILKR